MVFQSLLPLIGFRVFARFSSQTIVLVLVVLGEWYKSGGDNLIGYLENRGGGVNGRYCSWFEGVVGLVGFLLFSVF